MENHGALKLEKEGNLILGYTKMVFLCLKDYKYDITFYCERQKNQMGPTNILEKVYKNC